MYRIDNKYYMSFDELDEIEEKMVEKKDVISLDSEITEEILETFIINGESINITDSQKTNPIEFLFYLKEKISQNKTLYRNYQKSIKTIEKVINRHVEVMDREELEEFLSKKGLKIEEEIEE